MRVGRIALLLLVGLLGFFVILFSLGGTRRIHACESIKKGASLDEIVKVLGDPVSSYDRNKLTVFGFRPDALASGNILAIVDPETGRVMSLYCRHRQPPTWSAN